MKNCKFFIIHNLDPKRKENILKQLRISNIPDKDIFFINHPNKNELTYEIKKVAVQKNTRINNKVIKDGWISVSYKHYIALKEIVENKIEYSVIIEDNVGEFQSNIYERLEKYHSELPNDWGVVFESDQKYLDFEHTMESPVYSYKLLYKKSNEITYDESGKVLLHGGSRSAQFYYLNYQTAKKLYENYLPFNHAPDMWMNELFRKLDINSYWAEPTFIKTEKNHKTSTNLNLLKDFAYVVSSKLTNLRLRL